MALQRTGKRYPPCDTFFVESQEDEDEGLFEARRQARQRLQQINAETQYAMAEEMSRMVSEEYQEDILDHMEHMENETLPDVASIDIQTEIQWFMRPYLLDFLVEAHMAFSLLPETLFLTVNILDRYCSKLIVYKKHYQLVGCAAMLIAAKYGDKKDRVPTIKELQAMCCGLYDEKLFVQMERHVLQALGWVIGHPTVDTFLQMVLQEVNYDPEVESMARYLAEIAFFHKDFVSVRPSVMARTAYALARHILGRALPRHSDWASRYDTTVLVLLSQHLYRPSPVLQRKYSTREHSRVANTLEEFMARQTAMARQRFRQHPHQMATIMTNRLKPQDANFSTPHKGQNQVPHGYITPPVTPSADYPMTDSYPTQEPQQSQIYTMLS
ncbi:cyclin-like protein [Kalaharituber pfeilii]|nr:cyclin-like protein [Kalaharituber pfeilii]